MSRVIPARLFLIPAYKAPQCVVVRRKPNKLWHIMLWDTRIDNIQHGSWFHGTLYPNRFDLSWDGRWLVYFAMGREGNWTGVCHPPKLTTVRHWQQDTTYLGGGVFAGKDLMLLNTMEYPRGSTPPFPPAKAHGHLSFRVEDLEAKDGSEDEGVLYPRLRRDGWHDVGVSSKDDSGWWIRPTRQHPVLRMWYRGVPERRRRWAGGFRVFDFELESHPELLKEIQWATWDSLGQLLVARKGTIEKYTLKDLAKPEPTPSFALDLNDLQR